MTNRQPYVEKLKARIDEWSAEIDKLEARAREARADARIEYDKTIAHLNALKTETRERLDEIRNAGESSWEELKDGADKAWTAMREGIEKARAELR